MRTAMQEMIQNIIDIESKTYNQEQLYMLTSLKVSALILLEREREQIIDAFDNGVYVGVYAIDKYGEQYYNQTYNEDSELPKEDKTFKQKSKWTKL
jgi:hypothetical protein